MSKSFVTALALVLAACSGATGDATPASVATTTTVAAPMTTEPLTTTTEATTTTTTIASTTTADIEPPPADTPPGWNTFTGAAAAISAPPGWIDAKELLEDPEARAAFVEEVQDQSADDFLDQLAPQILNIIDVFLFDVLHGTPEFVTNVNVIVSDAGPLADLTTIEATIPSQLDAFGARLVSTGTADVGGFETLIVEYDLDNAAGTVRGRQYYQIREELVTVTFTASDPDVDLWDQMMETVVLLP